MTGGVDELVLELIMWQGVRLTRKGWEPPKHLSLSLSASFQVSSEQLCPTWTGRHGTSMCSSSRPKTWSARWVASLAPPLSLSHSLTSTTTHLGSLTVRLLIVSIRTIKVFMYSTCHFLSNSAIRINPPAPCFICGGFFLVPAEWAFKDLILLKNHLNSENQMRAYFVLYAVNTVVQKRQGCYSTLEKKSLENFKFVLISVTTL